MAVEDFNQSDEAWWRDLKKGSEQAYAYIYQSYTPILFKYGMKLVRDRELVKDAIQDLFVYLWEAKERLGETKAIKYYLFRALRRIIFGKMNASVSLSDSEFSLEGLTADWVFSPEEVLIQDETAEQYVALFSKNVDLLPDRQKEAVFLRFYNNMEFPEIAQLMGITVRATYKLIYKAIEALQKNITLECILLTILNFLWL